MKKTSYADAKQYRKFIEDRDRALDDILFKYRVLISNILQHAQKETVQRIVGLYATGQLTARTSSNENLIAALKLIYSNAVRDTYLVYAQAIKRGYSLSLIGEAEAIGRVKKKLARYEVAFSAGDKTLHRVRIYYERLLRNVIDKTQLASLYAKDVQDFHSRIESAFPNSKQYKRPPRSLKPLKEAKKPFILSDDAADELERELGEEYTSAFYNLQLGKEIDMATGLVSQDDWDAIVKDYKAEHIEPVTIFGRGETTKYKVGGDELYDWELDRDLMNEFVSQVRAGQVEAAKQNNITDFVWIAIVDNKTDECCLWRDGLTTKEIERELPKHDDDCEGATTPPAHRGCRCRLAPYDESVDTTEFEDLPDYGDFDQWINS